MHLVVFSDTLPVAMPLQAPTLKSSLTKMKEEVEALRSKMASQDEKIKSLTEDRDFLRGQLSGGK